MDKMDAVTEPVYHARQIVIHSRTKRSSTKRNTVGRHINCFQKGCIVGLGGDDTGQTEQGKWWVIRVTAEA